MCCRDFDFILTRNRDDPLVKASVRRDQFAEARETLGRRRLADFGGRCFEATRRAVFATQGSLREARFETALRTLDAPEIRQRVRC